MDNIEEMPIHHTTWCKQGDEDLILQYNQHDVKATYLFLLTTLGKTEYSLYKGKDKIKLRRDLTKKFGVDCLNLPDVGMGEKLMLKLYSEATNQNQWEVKKRKTIRNGIALKNCIPYWCNIKSPEFNKFLELIKSTTVIGEKGEFDNSIMFHGYQFDFGLGGNKIYDCHTI